ncbi:N-acetylmuramoyl-L-alanine amidase, partial [Rhizobium phaseoli]
MTSFEADYAGACVRPSPNHGERADGRRPDMILLHYTGMPTPDGALDWLCRAESQVSSHYFVHENGEVIQL